MHKDHVKAKQGTIGLLHWVLFIVCRLLMMTWRVKVVGMDRRRRSIVENPRGSFVLATFHENAIAGVLSHPGQGITVLASRSKDGEIVAFLCEQIGLHSVRGSSSRGGKEARDELVEILRSGVSGAITVDGPRGPRRVPKAGIVDVARKSGSPILPVVCMADRSWIFAKTWDQTRIPKPFSRVLVYYGEPIFVPQSLDGEDFERCRQQVAEQLTQDDERARVQFSELWSMAKPFPHPF